MPADAAPSRRALACSHPRRACRHADPPSGGDDGSAREPLGVPLGCTAPPPRPPCRLARAAPAPSPRCSTCPLLTRCAAPLLCSAVRLHLLVCQRAAGRLPAHAGRGGRVRGAHHHHARHPPRLCRRLCAGGAGQRGLPQQRAGRGVWTAWELRLWHWPAACCQPVSGPRHPCSPPGLTLCAPSACPPAGRGAVQAECPCHHSTLAAPGRQQA